MNNNFQFEISDVANEETIVDMARSNLGFFQSNNIRFTLPNTTVREEYDRRRYEDFVYDVRKKWQKEQPFLERVFLFFHLPESASFTIVATNYGPLGFYDPRTNRIMVNMNTHWNPIETIKHELLHIIMEPYVTRNQIAHSHKESLIDKLQDILAV